MKNRTKQSFNSAAKSYIKSYGGARKISNTAISGKQTGGVLAGFLSDVASRGIRESIASLGLEKYEGKSIDFLLTKIADKLAPSGATNEEAAARIAVLDAMTFYMRHLNWKGKTLLL